jgi:hypothetical protein
VRDELENFFLSFIECRGISDPLATLFGGEGIDEHMRRADQALVHGRHGLDGQPFIDQGLVVTAAKLGQGFGQHKMGLRTVESNVFYTTGRHDRHLGTQPLTDGFIGGTHFVFEHLQSQQHTHGNGAATAGRTLGKTPGKALLDGLDHIGPRKRIDPLTDGTGFGNDVGNPQVGTATAEPMLKVAYQTQREASFSNELRTSQDMAIRTT